MNVKVAITLLCAVQLATGFSLSSGFNSSSISSIFNNVAEKIHDFAVQAEEQFKTALNDSLNKAEQQAEAIKEEMQAKLDEIATESQAALECVQAEKQNLSSTVDLAKQALQSYGVKEGLTALPLIGKVNATFNKAKNMSATFVQEAKDCGIFSFSCLSGVVQSAISEGQELASEASAEASQVKTFISKAITDFETAATNLFEKEKALLQDIEEEVQECIEAAKSS